jgi:hypothetical protein
MQNLAGKSTGSIATLPVGKALRLARPADSTAREYLGREKFSGRSRVATILTLALSAWGLVGLLTYGFIQLVRF